MGAPTNSTYRIQSGYKPYIGEIPVRFATLNRLRLADNGSTSKDSLKMSAALDRDRTPNIPSSEEISTIFQWLRVCTGLNLLYSV